MRMLYLVRDYERLKSEREDILNSSPPIDGIPHSGIGNPTEQKAMKLAMIDRECDAVSKAIAKIPDEYRKPIINNICYGSQYPYTAHRNTYSYWRARLLNNIAQNLGLV